MLGLIKLLMISVAIFQIGLTNNIYLDFILTLVILRSGVYCWLPEFEMGAVKKSMLFSHAFQINKTDFHAFSSEPDASDCRPEVGR